MLLLFQDIIESSQFPIGRWLPNEFNEESCKEPDGPNRWDSAAATNGFLSGGWKIWITKRTSLSQRDKLRNSWKFMGTATKLVWSMKNNWFSLRGKGLQFNIKTCSVQFLEKYCRFHSSFFFLLLTLFWNQWWDRELPTQDEQCIGWRHLRLSQIA